MEANFVSAGTPFWDSTVISIAQARTMPEAGNCKYESFLLPGVRVRFRAWTDFCMAGARNPSHVEVIAVAYNFAVGYSEPGKARLETS